MASHQDWTPVVWKKNERATGQQKEAVINKARREGSAVETEKKFLGGQNRATKLHLLTNAAKVEQETENFKIDRVAYEFRVALQRARQAKGLSQSALARLINEQESLLKEYENGSAIPNGAIVQKLSRALGTSLPSAKPKK
ncbi:bifunctional Lambda repressor-like [Babesia duncani]|uniref:Bifunctional Lambda repressor-like n=1 Tax=Babesia duncani TaxID=323732 RepID=A0AAD9PJW7_9APIC|nr:bifunctional Lambda repressor-like [Babesia duncani]